MLDQIRQPTHPQTHLGSTTKEPRLGTAIFELHPLTQLICILQQA